MSANNSGVRDINANRTFGNGVGSASAVSPVILSDVANADFTPVANGCHIMVPTAARALTITAASAAKTNLRVGEGFQFYIHNASAGAFSITLVAGGGANVETLGTTTLVIAQGESGLYSLHRTAAATYGILGLGVNTH